MNDAPVLGLYEGGLLIGERTSSGARLRLEGARCRVFVKGEAAYEAEPGADLSEFMAG